VGGDYLRVSEKSTGRFFRPHGFIVIAGWIEACRDPASSGSHEPVTEGSDLEYAMDDLSKEIMNRTSDEDDAIEPAR
jgi:hypothetical protein